MVMLLIAATGAFADSLCVNPNSTAVTGNLYDSGGSGGNYGNNETCSFLLQPAGGGTITLSFSAFNYEAGYDDLTVYDGTSAAGVLLGSFDGTTVPSDLTATSGAMFVVHDTDFSVVRSGFAAAWSISAAASCAAISDDFSSGTYSGGSGWSADWVDFDDDGSAAGGDVVMTGGVLRLDDNSSPYGDPGLYRDLDLSGLTGATLSFDFTTSGTLEGSDRLDVDMSSDGGVSYTTIWTQSNDGSGTASLSLASYLVANARIRIVVDRNTGGGDEYFQIDNVQIDRVGDCGALVAHYAMESAIWNGTPGELVDSGANGLSGVAFGDPDSIPGRVCNAGRFDGDDYFEVADDSNLDITDELTVSAWINPTALPGSDYYTVFSKDENFELHINPAGQLVWWWQNSLAATRTFTSSAVIVTSVWTHVAIVYSKSANRQSIYINGSEDAFQTYAAEDLMINSDPLQIGADQGYGDREFIGAIDEVIVSSYARSQADIQALVDEINPCSYFVITGNDSSLSSSSGNWSWDGSEHAAWRAAMENTSNFGPGGIVDTPVSTVDITAINATTLDGIDAFVSSWWTTSQSAAHEAALVTFFLNGGDLVLFQDNNDRDGIGEQLGISTANNSTGDTSVFDPIDTVFGGVGTVSYAGERGYLDGATVTGLGGTICGTDSAGRTTIACWAEGEFAPGAGTLVILGDTDYVTSNYGGANYSVLNDKGRLGLNVIEFLINDEPSGSCTLGGFQITQPAYGLACPTTRATVGIVALCDDLITTKTDYAGTIDLSTSDPANSEFYLGLTGGPPVTSVILSGGEGGTTDVYLYHQNADGNLLVTAIDNVSATGTTASVGTTFGTAGFVVASPTDFFCGNSSTMMLTAIGQDISSPGICQKLDGFAGSKNLKVWYEVNVDPSGNPGADAVSTDLVMDGTAISDQTEPGASNFSVSFVAGETASFPVSYDNAGQFLGVYIKHDDAPYDGSVIELPPLLSQSNSFVVAPAQIMVFENDAADSTDCAVASATCDVFKQAGENFSLQADAVCTNSMVADDYEGSVGLTLSVVEPAGGSDGALDVSTLVFDASANGSVVEGAEQISEVGVFTITTSPLASPLQYFGVNLDAFTTANIGRFKPASFLVQIDSAAFASACTNYTYLAQPFDFSLVPLVTITAVEASGATTTNYEGDFWKLGTTLPASGNCASINGFCYADNVAGASSLVAPVAVHNYGAGNIASAAGTLQFSLHTSETFYYTKPLAALDPFDADAALTVYLRDSDDVVGSATLARIGFTGESDLAPAAMNTNNDQFLRFGRWNMENAYGPETESVVLPGIVEYFSSGDYFMNPDDNCSAIGPLITTSPVGTAGVNSITGIAVGGGTTTLNHSGASVVTGDAGIVFDAPGAANTGTVTVSVNLASLYWLRYDWDNNGTPEDKAAVEATFGQYRGHDRVIYWREL